MGSALDFPPAPDTALQLDEELAPDGYNVGFNAGEAAGQTVMHLHVHVIPRRRGDMDDPRGGVRHVIPSRWNYLRTEAPLATGGTGDPFARHVLPLFDRASEIAIVAAFVQESGVERIAGHLRAAVARGARVRVLTATRRTRRTVARLWVCARRRRSARGLPLRAPSGPAEPSTP